MPRVAANDHRLIRSLPAPRPGRARLDRDVEVLDVPRAQYQDAQTAPQNVESSPNVGRVDDAGTFSW